MIPQHMCSPMRLRSGAMCSEFQPSGARTKAPILKQAVGVWDVPEALRPTASDVHGFERVRLARTSATLSSRDRPDARGGAQKHTLHQSHMPLQNEWIRFRAAPDFLPRPQIAKLKVQPSPQPAFPDASRAQEGSSPL